MIADSDPSDQENEVGEALDVVDGSEVSDDVMEQADEIPESTAEAVPFDRNLPASHRNSSFHMYFDVRRCLHLTCSTAVTLVKRHP